MNRRGPTNRDCMALVTQEHIIKQLENYIHG